jgi:hypothetical protein
MIHLKIGETKLTDMGRQTGFHWRTAGDQYYLVSAQRPGNLKTAKQVADAQNVLTILDYFHVSGKFNRW